MKPHIGDAVQFAPGDIQLRRGTAHRWLLPPPTQHSFECLESVVPFGTDLDYPSHRFIEGSGSESVTDLPTFPLGGYETSIRERSEMFNDRLATDRHLLGKFRGACLTKL
jgi:hypothetical protein